jgi:phosphatidylethanolamine/phosphatidyl-N-methylethanolamine N-methyltransferase
MAHGILHEYLDFFRAFAARPKFTGAIAPSSRDLARMMVRGFDLPGSRLVVEVGPGTGAITRTILERLPRPERYLGLELNPDFVRRLRRRFPDARFVQGSAEDAGAIVTQHGGGQPADYVVCGLPWSMFSTALQERILGSIASVLCEGGGFSTFAYVHAVQFPQMRRFRRILLRHFRRVEVSPVVWKNIPPAVSYHCFR